VKELKKMFGFGKKKFTDVHIDRELVEEIIDIAKESYPNEFSAMLQGKIEENILKIDGLIFLPGAASESGAVMEIFMMPLLSDAVGSVHSHPGHSAAPSVADLQFFSKRGYFHIIIAVPYNEDSILAYDGFGDLVEYKIV
jgi:proteasome lid subunit RPN8/RPN11